MLHIKIARVMRPQTEPTEKATIRYLMTYTNPMLCTNLLGTAAVKLLEANPLPGYGTATLHQ